MPLTIPSPILGLSTGKPGEFIDQRATPDCQNVQFNRFTIGKRVGTSVFGSSGLGERVLALPELTLGINKFPVRIGPTKIQSYDSGTDAWSSIASAALTADDTYTVSYCFPNLSGSKVLVYTNYIDAVRKWTGSGNDADVGGSPPLAKFCVAFGPYLVLLNVIDSGNNLYSRVQWCDTGDIETWDSGNAGFVDLIDDEQAITGAGIFGEAIAVHKNSGIYLGYLVSSSGVFQFDRKSTGVGAAVGATIKTLPTGLQAFLATDGLRMFDGSTTTLIDADIHDEIRETVNPQYLYKATATVVPELDEYWLAVPIGSQSEPSTVYKFNYKTGQVYKDARTNVTSFGVMTNTTQRTVDDVSTAVDSTPGNYDDVYYLNLNPIVTFGYSDGTTEKRSGIFSDNGEAIDGYWTSKDYTYADFGGDDPGHFMRFNQIQVWAKGTAMDVAYSIDAGLNWTAIATLTLSSDFPTDDAPAYGYFDVLSTKIRFRFRNNLSNGWWNLKQFQIAASIREARR